MAILSHCTLLEEEWKWMEHYILEMRLPTPCFWSLEPRKFKRRIKGNAEVDATGRYIRSRGCAEGYMPLCTLLVGYYYTNGVGVFSSLFILQVFLGS